MDRYPIIQLLQYNIQKIYRFFYLAKNRSLTRTLKDLEKNQYLHLKKIEDLNWSKRKSLVWYAYKNVPYYTQKYNEAGFHPIQLRQPEDYLKVPLLTREDIKYNIYDMVSKNADINNLYLTGTGGTTGEPLTIYKIKDDMGISSALGIRMLRWWQVKPICNFATAYRITSKRSKEENNKGGFRKKLKHTIKITRQALKNLINKRIQLDASYMNALEMNAFIKKMNDIKPEYLVGYVGAINELANYIESQKVQLPMKLKAVWVTAAPLTKSVRNNIEKAFNAPVYDQYGSIEVFFLAAECQKQDGLHFFYDARHIEFIDDNGKPTNPNVTGNVVITDLENYTFPIIRYVNGDMGSWKGTKCTCGINLPLINNIQGRTSDRIYLNDGSSISGEFLTTIFDEYAQEIKGFQVHQIAEDKMYVKLVMENPDKFKVISELVEKQLHKTTRELINIEFISVPEIKHNRGKLNYVISDLQSRV